MSSSARFARIFSGTFLLTCSLTFGAYAVGAVQEDPAAVTAIVPSGNWISSGTRQCSKSRSSISRQGLPKTYFPNTGFRKVFLTPDEEDGYQYLTLLFWDSYTWWYNYQQSLQWSSDLQRCILYCQIGCNQAFQDQVEACMYDLGILFEEYCVWKASINRDNCLAGCRGC